MMHWRRRSSLSLVVSLLTAWSSVQLAPKDARAQAASPTDDAAKIAEAKEHFARGFQLMQEESWDAALAEFLASTAILPRPNSMKNAAICLKQLQRYAESLEMFQRLSKELAALLTPSDAQFVEKSIHDLEALTGSIVIQSDVADATVVIDGKERGKTPLAAPVLVSAGTRSVRISKGGYSPFEAKPIVAGKSTVVVDAHLEPLAHSGRLSVSEASGQVLDVVVDGAVLGKTPFVGALDPGQHSVLLRGPEKLGTQPTTADVSIDETVTLRLVARELRGVMRVEPEPAGATVLLDGELLGRGTWEGAVLVGSHELQISAPGYFAKKSSFEAPDGRAVVLKLSLDRDDNSPFWTKGRTYPLSLAIFGGGLFGTTLGGDYEASCSAGADCYGRSRPLGVITGARGAYDLAPGLAIELEVGFLLVKTRVSRRTQLVGDVGLVPVDIEDDVTLSGPLIGAGASYAFVRRPLVVSGALSGGIVLARIKEGRTGTATVDTEPTKRPLGSLPVDPVTKTMPFVMPEVRVALPLSDAFQIGLSLGVLIGFADVRPRVRQQPVGSDNDFITKPDGTKVPMPPQYGGKGIGYLPQGSTESATGTFILAQASMFARLAF